jgi:hypothetical protein
MPPKTKLAVPFAFRCGNHSAVASADDLSRVERETGDVAMRLTDLFPIVIPENFTPDGAGRILDDRQFVLAPNLQNLAQVARHTHLMDAQDSPSSLANGSLE